MAIKSYPDESSGVKALEIKQKRILLPTPTTRYWIRLCMCVCVFLRGYLRCRHACHVGNCNLL